MTTESRQTESEAHPLAVVSGAGSGIGRAIAVRLGGRGGHVALLGRREEPLRETLAAVEAAGGTGEVMPVDVRDETAVGRLAEDLVARHGAPEIVVPAAGTASIAPLEETDVADLRTMLETNLVGTFLLFRAFLSAMKARGRGRLVPVLSVAAREGFPGWGAYGASKWGLRGLVASLRAELAGTGLLVTALYPGATDTPIWHGSGMTGDWDRSKMIPPEEVARLLLAALDADPRALVEEIHVGPAGGVV